MDDILRLLLDAEDIPEKDVPVSRFGTFRIRAIGDKELKTIRDRSEWNGVIDLDTFRSAIIAKGCVKPQWNHPQLLEKYNTSDEVEVVKKRLLPGEKEFLSNAIMSLSGFGENESEAIGNVKN